MLKKKKEKKKKDEFKLSFLKGEVDELKQRSLKQKRRQTLKIRGVLKETAKIRLCLRPASSSVFMVRFQGPIRDTA